MRLISMMTKMYLNVGGIGRVESVVVDVGRLNLFCTFRFSNRWFILVAVALNQIKTSKI